MNEEAMTPDKEQVVEPCRYCGREGYDRVYLDGDTPRHIDCKNDVSTEMLDHLRATLDAARTASVAGLDANGARHCIAQASVYLASGNIIAAHDELDAALAALNSAPSIEQEPGEAACPACGGNADHEAWTIGDDSYGCAALREQEPGDPLRAAVLYGPDVEFPNLPNGPYLTGPDVLLAVAHYMDRQDDEAERMAAGSGYRANRDVQAHLREWSRRLRAALEADRNPQETER